MESSASLASLTWLADAERPSGSSVSFAQPYWLTVNDTTRADMGRILEEGVTEGWSIRRMAQNVERMASGYSLIRARLVARTESSRALNAGHAMAIDELSNETGLPIGKEWVSTMGNTTRDTHAAADGQIVAADELFNVGGYSAPYPGHRSLPVGEVANCMCTIVSAVDESVIAAVDN